MKKYVLLLSFVVLGCSKKEKPAAAETCTPTKTESRFKMYEMSEMSALMEQMYVDNQRLKERIKNGDTIGKFPNHFLKIHKAAMTDESENDAFFKEQAALFIKAQELIYEDPKNAKQHFNEGVDACISCHQGKCGGPIPRIKKLYLK
jgi:hypothetical protein